MGWLVIFSAKEEEPVRPDLFYCRHRGLLYKVLASPFHNGDLLVGQAVEFIDDLVDEPIGAADALDEIAVAGGVAVVDLHEAAEAVDRPGQGADEALEGGFVPGEGFVEGAGAFAVGVEVRGQRRVFGQPGFLLALVAQLVEGGGVGRAFEVGPEVGGEGLLVLVHGDHLFGEVGEEIVDVKRGTSNKAR